MSHCPFHPEKGGIALSDLPGIIRCCDRIRLERAMEQMVAGVRVASDLDEAKGEALTFIAVVTAATLEMGGSRAMHRVQLDAARALEQQTDREEVAQTAIQIVRNVCEPILTAGEARSTVLVDKAIAFIRRNYAEPITDDQVANHIELSTSHFRFLFRETTGMPFNRYLMGVRLEMARHMLQEDNMSVSDVAISVGFTGLAHFSRAFSQRFQVTPTDARKNSFAVQAQTAP